MQVRRVVTAKVGAGRSTVIMDGDSPRSRALKYSPGFTVTPLWFTRAPTKPVSDATDPVLTTQTLLPAAGETSFMIVTFPPDAVAQGPDFNPQLAGAEFLDAVPGIAHAMEPDNPGMHTTATVDYAIVLSGEIWLELDDGETIFLREHDVVIQNAARHAWRNKGDRAVTVAFVLVGASS